eukprot:TRINITY_DN5507_c0_g1_i1.p1 TRINITY_DN5507_c0_g1~~TRINITY_DN5507_c0_g1_i1.p1  ORF type:complete len:292 (+),score=81.01 TRINITY_DN5507_c0_g1_i1:75-878(+)
MSRLIAITGANRGFGRAIAVEAAKVWPKADLLLSMRSSSKGMEDTEDEVKKVGGTGCLSRWNLDISKPGSEVEVQTNKGLEVVNAKPYDEVLLINNAATLGKLSAPTDLTPADIQECMDTNVVSCLVVTTAFLKGCTCKKVTVVNISSGLAVNPKPGMALYCAVKALRDMFTRALSADNPSTRTLNYSPGPMDTGMQTDIRAKHPVTDVRNMFISLKEKGGIVDPYHSAEMLTLVLKENTFSNGDWVDYRHVLEKKNIPQREVPLPH